MEQLREERKEINTSAPDQFEQVLADDSPIREPAHDAQALQESFPDVVLHRSILNDIPMIVCFLIVGSIAWWMTLSLGVNYQASYNSLKPLLLFAGVLAVGVACAVVAFRMYNVRYLIANDGIKALRGFLSNHQVDAKLEYYQIRGTEIHRTFFERLVGTGDLVVRGSTGSDTEVALKGIRDPYRFQKLIQARHRLEVQGSKAAWINGSSNIRKSASDQPV